MSQVSNKNTQKSNELGLKVQNKRFQSNTKLDVFTNY